MKCPFLVALSLATAASAQEHAAGSQQRLQHRFDEMKAEAWFQNGGWLADLGAAKQRAKAANKIILAYFTRSYAP